MKKLTGTIVLIAAIVALPAHAIGIKTHKQQMALGGQNAMFASAYLMGVGYGFFAVNMQMILEHKPQLYCQPEKFSLSADDFQTILDKEVERLSKIKSMPDEYPVEAILLSGMKETFPCKEMVR
jgi:hypothetical protein